MMGLGILSPTHITIIWAFRDDATFTNVVDALAALGRYRVWRGLPLMFRR